MICVLNFAILRNCIPNVQNSLLGTKGSVAKENSHSCVVKGRTNVGFVFETVYLSTTVLQGVFLDNFSRRFDTDGLEVTEQCFSFCVGPGD